MTNSNARFSSQTIDALAQIITGGSATDGKPAVGLYRSAWHLEKFMNDAGHGFALAGRSRVPAIREALAEIASGPLGKAHIHALIERAADPRDFISEPERGQSVLSYLNAFLAYDDLEIVLVGKRARVRPLGAQSPVVNSITDKTVALNFEAVGAEVDRALKAADVDPPVAVTAACVMIEGICRAILAELRVEAPSKRDVEALLRAVQEPLGLSPARSDLPPLIASDVRQVLGGLTTVTKGIGALRTHGGSAHAAEVGQAPIDARIARFAIHSASTIAYFLVESFERKVRRDASTGRPPK